MVIGIAPAHQSATIKLQFLDPEQFKKPAEGEANEASSNSRQESAESS